MSVIGLSLIVWSGGIYMVGVVASSVRSSPTAALDTVVDLLFGVEVVDEVTAPVYESMVVFTYSTRVSGPGITHH